jgi:hypothetical protein
MSESKIIEEVLQHLLGGRLKLLHEVRVVWEDQYILSLRWKLKGGAKGWAKVIKEESDWRVSLTEESHV